MASAGIVLAVAAPGVSSDVRGWLDFGPDFSGGSVDPGHEGWAGVTAFSVRHSGETMELVCRRRVDKASPLLMKAGSEGIRFPAVKLDVALRESGSDARFWEMTLNDVEISSYEGAHDPEGGAAEELRLTWKSLEFTYRVIAGGGVSYPVAALVSPDTDGDGLPDAYEERFGLDPKVSNAGVDSDGDGLTDVEEYRLGTDPMDPTSFFKVTGIADHPEAGRLTLRWPSVPGEDYEIDFSPDLVTSFVPLATVTATGNEMSYEVPRTAARGFFQVRKDLP